MTDLMMTEYRHAKIADLLSIMWACNDADSDNAPEWTRPMMAAPCICNPLMKAVRGLLMGDFYIYDNASDLVEDTVTALLDNHVHEGYGVTREIDIVLNDNQ